MSLFPKRWTRPLRLPGLSPAPLEYLRSYFFPLFWGVQDRERFASHIKAAADLASPGVHFADNFLTWSRNNSMLDDAEFTKVFDANVESESDKAIIWRRYILCCAAYHCVQLRGDFVECGGYTGVGVKTVIDYLGGMSFPKTFWLYDLFEHDPSMEHHSMPEHGPTLESRVREKFADYTQVNVVKGNIPGVFAGRSPKHIAYLHIDLNQAPAEIAALDALFDRVTPGGIVVLDDYEWSGFYRRQKLAEDPWFEARQYRVIPLPTGQGLVIKR